MHRKAKRLDVSQTCLPCLFTTVHAALALYRPIDTDKCSPIGNSSYDADSEIALEFSQTLHSLVIGLVLSQGTHRGRPRVPSRSEARQATPGASIAGESDRAHHRGGRREVGVKLPNVGCSRAAICIARMLYSLHLFERHVPPRFRKLSKRYRWGDMGLGPGVNSNAVSLNRA